jgi:hypothetical protein
VEEGGQEGGEGRQREEGPEGERGGRGEGRREKRGGGEEGEEGRDGKEKEGDTGEGRKGTWKKGVEGDNGLLAKEPRAVFKDILLVLKGGCCSVIFYTFNAVILSGLVTGSNIMTLEDTLGVCFFLQVRLGMVLTAWICFLLLNLGALSSGSSDGVFAQSNLAALSGPHNSIVWL